MLYKKVKLNILLISLFFCLFAIAWRWLFVPNFNRLSHDFSYHSVLHSFDNFYNEEQQVFLGDTASISQFTFEIIEKKGNAYIIKNELNVRKMTGEKIFTVERLYGVDKRTGKHVPGVVDQDRTGYLFAPLYADKNNYVYWHINYNAPATLVYQEEETVLGLRVFRYKAEYSSDQTKNLGYLPGVPETRGVNTQINLQLWIEPISGHLVKYEDHALAYYYDVKTGEKLHPWNKFNNRYASQSIQAQVNSAKRAKTLILLKEWGVPISSIFLSIILIFIALCLNKQQKQKS